MLRILRNWKIPTVILVLLILAMVFRWDSIGSITKDGIIIETSKDRWNGAVWQITITNGRYEEKIIQPSWIESGRTKVDKKIEYQEPVYREEENPNKDKYDSRIFGKTFDTIRVLDHYETVTKTIQVPPEQLYWPSRSGLTKIWTYLASVMVIWLITAIVIRTKQKKTVTETVKNNI